MGLQDGTRGSDTTRVPAWMKFCAKCSKLHFLEMLYRHLLEKYPGKYIYPDAPLSSTHQSCVVHNFFHGNPV